MDVYLSVTVQRLSGRDLSWAIRPPTVYLLLYCKHNVPVYLSITYKITGNFDKDCVNKAFFDFNVISNTLRERYGFKLTSLQVKIAVVMRAPHLEGTLFNTQAPLMLNNVVF
jgi:hypothetical protein